MERRPPNWRGGAQMPLSIEERQTRAIERQAQAISAAGDFLKLVGYVVCFSIIAIVASRFFYLVYQSFKTGFSPL